MRGITKYWQIINCVSVAVLLNQKERWISTQSAQKDTSFTKKCASECPHCAPEKLVRKDKAVLCKKMAYVCHQENANLNVVAFIRLVLFLMIGFLQINDLDVTTCQLHQNF